MSIALPTLDLTSKAIGYTADVNFGNVGINSYSGQGQTLFIINDSAAGLQCTFSTGSSFFLGAGGWVPQPIPPNATSLKIRIVYLLPNPPINIVLFTFYGQGEQVPTYATLGNSPIQGVTQTSSIQTLSNEGQAKTLLVIDIGDSVLANLWQINNDGTCTLKVDVAGVAHQVLKIANAANFLQLAQAGDTIEILGNLTVDQNISGAATFTGDIAANGAGTGLAVQNNETVGGTLTVTGDATFNGAGTGVSVASTAAAASFNSNSFRDGTNGNLAMDLSAVDGTVAFPKLLKPNVGGTVVNGTQGSLTFYTPVWGSAIKVLIVVVNNYKNTAVASFNFPTVMNSMVFGIFGNMGSATPTISFFRSGSAQNLDVLTTLASTGGTTVTSTNIAHNSVFYGAALQSYDQMQMSVVSTTGSSCMILVVGI